MTENKRFTIGTWEDTDWIMDNGKVIYAKEIVDLLNEQHEELKNRKQIIKTITNDYNELEQAKNSLLEENEQLKQQIRDLYKFVKCDVDNEIDVYPKSILEHLVNILKIIGDVE